MIYNHTALILCIKLLLCTQLSTALLTKTLNNERIMHIVVTNDSCVRVVINTFVMICKCSRMNAVQYKYIFLIFCLPACTGGP